jgi:hypothetical protein
MGVREQLASYSSAHPSWPHVHLINRGDATYARDRHNADNRTLMLRYADAA